MKKIVALTLLLFTFVFVGCNTEKANDTSDEQSKTKYQIENLGTLSVDDSDFEKMYEKAKNSAFSWIDSIGEDEYLGPEKCKMTIFSDNSMTFLLATVDKPDVEDDTVLVTYSYNTSTKEWKRESIMYNKIEYGK